MKNGLFAALLFFSATAVAAHPCDSACQCVGLLECCAQGSEACCRKQEDCFRRCGDCVKKSKGKSEGKKGKEK